MMIFKPDRGRNGLLSEDKSMLKWYLNKVYDEARPMGNVALSDLEVVIKAYLLGLHQELSPVIPRSLKWLDLAIAKDEKLGINHDYHRKELQWAKAMGLWLEDNVTDEESWHKARVYEEVSWRCDQEPVTRREIVNDALDDYMAFSCQAIEEPEELEAGIDMYEHWIGATKLNFKKTLKPKEYGYALCLHHARYQFDEAELLAAGQKMLTANLQEKWLGGGQYTRAATWLKTVYWNSGITTTPLETILKAYDHMPDVPRPDYV
jgi:hypothetical protein